MEFKGNLRSDRLLLRCLADADVTERYVGWLNDPEVNRFLEIRLRLQTISSTQRFVHSVNTSDNSILFGMFFGSNQVHIGNIKLGAIDQYHLRGDIGLVVGERSYWGQGLATEAIMMVARYGLQNLGLKKLSAGCYASNVGSRRAFEKAGFKVEGILISHWRGEEGREDGVVLGLTQTPPECANRCERL